MKRVLITITLLIGTILMSNAQESIKAVIKKCEKISSVEMSYIINKDPQTKKVQNSVTTLKITDDPNLVKEFIAAFEKEKDNAYSISGSIKNGVSTPSSYKFLDRKGNYISCTISISEDNASASVSYRESPNKPGNISLFTSGRGVISSYGIDSIISTRGMNTDEWIEEVRKILEERKKEINEMREQLIDEVIQKIEK